MFFVHVRYHGPTSSVQAGVRYISHREESLPDGKTRPLYGIGERYKALRGDEKAITQQLREDGVGLKDPRYFRIKLTVDDAAAQKLSRLSARGRELVIRDAVERTFRGTLRLAQGVFVIHEHGGVKRPFGHPHAHVHLSPLMANGEASRRIPPRRLQAFKDRWEREVTTLAERMLEREGRGPRLPLRALMVERRPRRRKRDPARLALVREGLLTLQRWRARGPLRELSPALDEALRARRLVRRITTDPAQMLAREGLKRLLRTVPDRLWAPLEIARLITRVIPR